MIEALGKEIDPIKDDGERASFLRAAASASTREHKKDAYFFLLIDPNESEVRRTVAEAVRSGRFGNDELTFKGFRGTKLLDPVTGTTRSILWPSFCWVHSQIQSAATRFRTFQLVGKDERFYFDKNDRRFSTENLKEIMNWVANPETTPHDPHALREEREV